MFLFVWKISKKIIVTGCLGSGKTALPEIYDLLNKYKENRNVFIFKPREEADEYIKRIKI